MDANFDPQLPRSPNPTDTNPKVTETVVASGLDNPRHLTFGPDDALYVTEAGRGGNGVSVPAPEIGVTFKFGSTGAVTRVQGDKQERIITELPSLALEDGSQAYGPHDVGFNQNGDLYVITGFTTNPDVRDGIGIPGLDLGRLFKFNQNSNSSGERLADFVRYEGSNNSDGGDDIVSNPYDLLVQEDNVLVVDAGANVLLRVDNGDISVEAVFNPRDVGGTLMQSVPSAVKIGPDGAYYVSEFTGAPYPEDGARIYRVLPGKEPEVYADGFTNIADFTFGCDGSLYVLEFAANSLSSDSQAGALIKVSPDGVRTTLDSDGLVFPTGVEVGPDGAIYVSNYGASAGEGQIVRYTVNEDSNKEPLFGNSGDDTSIGRGGIDTLIGYKGNDSLIAGVGADRLIGGTEQDYFVFKSTTEGSDTITDFSLVNDTIDASNVGFGGGLTAGAAITAGQFRLETAAGDIGDRIYNEKTSGALLFGADGTDAIASVQFA